MENKEIYIDGVDVSGCGWYTQGATGMICADWHISNDCCKNPNCHYKNWKHKEQECEELKIYIESNEQQVKEIETLVMDNDRLINELDQLKAENEKIEQCLIEQNRLVVGMTKEISDLTHKKYELEHELNLIKEENIIFTLDSKKLIAQYSAKLKQLRQTLTEIKPILEFYANSKMGEEQPDGTYKTMLNNGYIMTYDPNLARKTLQKISEVEDETTK